MTKRVANQGYTIVELMMAIAVFAIGVSGIIAMQKVAAAANQHSRSLSLATNIGQAWQDQLNIDSSLYTRTNGFTNTVWLSQLTGGNNQAGWLRPTWNTNLGIGAAFDALGRPLNDSTTDLANTQFCVHLRLTRLYPGSVGIDVIRTEVRVIWPRTEGTMSAAFCNANTDVTALAADSSNYHSLYQVSAVRQQP
jgi:prepilin-type N-terminal cleavage/methylation domain-containing protein